MDSLIVDYLQRHGYDYSLSVFLPECGLTQEQQVCLKQVVSS